MWCSNFPSTLNELSLWTVYYLSIRPSLVSSFQDNETTLSLTRSIESFFGEGPHKLIKASDDESVKRVLLRRSTEGYSLYRTRYLVAAEFRIETGAIILRIITCGCMWMIGVGVSCMWVCEVVEAYDRNWKYPWLYTSSWINWWQKWTVRTLISIARRKRLPRPQIQMPKCSYQSSSEIETNTFDVQNIWTNEHTVSILTCQGAGPVFAGNSTHDDIVYNTSDTSTPAGPFVVARALYNNEAFHTAAVALNIIDNVLLRHLTGFDDYTIVAVNHPVDGADDMLTKVPVMKERFTGLLVSVVMLFGMSFYTSTFVMFLIQERKIGCLRCQGTCSSSYSYHHGFFLHDITWPPDHLYVCLPVDQTCVPPHLKHLPAGLQRRHSPLNGASRCDH